MPSHEMLGTKGQAGPVCDGGEEGDESGTPRRLGDATVDGGTRALPEESLGDRDEKGWAP